MIKIKLDNANDISRIIFSQKRYTTEQCPQCQENFYLWYNKFNGRQWFAGECQCGKRIYLGQEEINILQPSSNLFKIVYGDVFAEGERNAKLKKQQEGNRKDALDIKFNKKFTKPWERKFVKEKVLGEDWFNAK